MSLPTDKAVEQIVERAFPGSRVRRAWPLTGGISAAVTAIEIEQPDGRVRRLTLRQPGALDGERASDTSEKEHRVLQFLHDAGLPVPEPLLLDRSGEIVPGPLLLLEYIDGQPGEGPGDLNRQLKGYAETLARIHQFPATHPALSFLPSQLDDDSDRLAKPPATLNDGRSEGAIRDALLKHWPPRQRNQPTLLHGDIWPGNMVWHEGALVGIIDWEDAAVGDPVADLAVTRLEVLWAHGSAAMVTVTELYQAQTGVDLADLAVWDLCAALRPIPHISGWGLSPAEDTAQRAGYRRFVDQALEALAGTSRP